MPNVLVTTPFDEAQLDRLRQVSSRLTVTQGDPETADYAPTDVLYAGSLPRDPSRAPNLKWVQVHMAGVNALYDHPIYANSAIALTTASGVHAATVAEYAITALLGLKRGSSTAVGHPSFLKDFRVFSRISPPHSPDRKRTEKATFGQRSGSGMAADSWLS